jgi:hypothetical protein
VKKPTIYEALWSKLGREPTNAELKAEVGRIKEEALIDVAGRGGLAHQRKPRSRAIGHVSKVIGRPLRDVEPGLRGVASRITSAEERFIAFCTERGFTPVQAEKILRVYRKAKAIKIDPVTGQFTFTHGDFAETDVLRRAAETVEKGKRR